MVGAAKSSHHEGDEDEDLEFSSRTPLDDSSDKVEGMNSDQQKKIAFRSKHSETEQRRRSKINERFQTLRNIIPDNDQKRDRASFLLEVIQYIQFLKDKIQMYEGPYQGWSPEPSKLTPWRRASGPPQIFTEQSQLIRNGSSHEDNAGVDSIFLSNAHESLESSLNGEPVFKTMDEQHHTLGSQAKWFDWHGKQHENSEIQIADQNDIEEQKNEWEKDKCPNEYSQRVLNTLNQSLVSMGVDMSQANVSVELDIVQQTKCRIAISTSNSCEKYDHGHKKIRR
ncbi:unnamed protein product [Cuscuta campestris]|uniref:BHLH domain-containing protein n=1 Tax=Cuscuta campestris TaxID=132261 RepID=A0A484LUT6_9ASTE|nr:unnamed protein product [Cuscuta campestris]